MFLLIQNSPKQSKSQPKTESEQDSLIVSKNCLFEFKGKKKLLIMKDTQKTERKKDNDHKATSYTR